MPSRNHPRPLRNPNNFTAPSGTGKSTHSRLTPAEAGDHFFHQTYFPSTIIPEGKSADAFALRLKALDLMGRLTHLPIYELHCTISQEAVTLTLGALRENTPKR